jgi:NAD(P)H dehydrogenase (quinone)
MREPRLNQAAAGTRLSTTLIALACACWLAACGSGAPRERLIVSGASGQLGGLVVEELLARGVDAENLILVSRTPERLSHYAELGASVRYGDFTEPESLTDAYAGGTRMLLISIGGASGDRVALQAAAIEAARDVGVELIAYTSFTNADTSFDSAIAVDHRQTEENLRGSGVAWTFLRNQIYMNGLVAQAAEAVRTGELRASLPAEARIGYVTREDCAAAAAAVLTSPGHEYQIYDITGPELIGPREIAATAAAVSGRPVELIVVNEEDAFQALIDSGASAQAAEAAMRLELELASPLLRVTSDAVARLTGRPATSLRQLLEMHRGELVAGARGGDPSLEQ